MSVKFSDRVDNSTLGVVSPNRYGVLPGGVDTAQLADGSVTTQKLGFALPDGGMEGLTGTGAPTSGTPSSDGDWYMNLSNSDLYKKQSGSWTKINNVSQADIAGNTAAITTQQAELDNHQAFITRPRASGLDVRDFGSIVGSNADTTIRAAITAAYAASGAPDQTAYANGCVNVIMPRGAYHLGDTALLFPGSAPKYTPGLVAESAQGGVQLVFDSALTGPMISCGSETPSAGFANFTVQQTFRGIELRQANGSTKEGGIKSRASIFQTFDDVRVIGIGADNGKWDVAIGFDFRQSSEPNSNHQHLRLFRCHADFCTTGYAFEAVASLSGWDVHANGSNWLGAWFENVEGSWVGGNTQQGPIDPSSFPGLWFAGTRKPSWSSGMLYTAGLPASTGATLGVRGGAGNQFCTVTGLTDMLGWASWHDDSYAGDWLELIDPSPGSPDVISGLYQIEAVLSDTSCVIRKATLHSSTGGLTYKVRGTGGGTRLQFTGRTYHEGTGTYTKLAVGHSRHTTSFWNMDSVESFNQDYVADLHGDNIVRITSCPSVAAKTRLHYLTQLDTDLDRSTIVTDTYSRGGLTCRGARRSGGSVPGPVLDAKPRESRLVSALQARGYAVFDTRKISTVVLSGSDVTTWSDLTGTYTLSRINAGVAPQWTLNDSNFGAPSIKLTSGDDVALAGGLTADMAALFPAGRNGSTVVVIGRVPNTTPGNAQRRTGLHVAGFADNFVEWNSTALASGNYGSRLLNQADGDGYTRTIAPVDTLVHCFVHTTGFAGLDQRGAYSDFGWPTDFTHSNGRREFGFTSPQSGTNLDLLRYVSGSGGDNQCGDLYVTLIAIAPIGCTADEAETFVDLARNEFSGIPRV